MSGTRVAQGNQHSAYPAKISFAGQATWDLPGNQYLINSLILYRSPE